MNAYLANITAPSGKSWYQLAKAERESIAYEKLGSHFGFGYEFEIDETIV